MQNETVKALKQRHEQIDRRLAAIEKERDRLIEEKEPLLKLINYYDDMEYDSIEYERDVTEKLLQYTPNPPKEAPTQVILPCRQSPVEVKSDKEYTPKRGRRSKYYKYFDAIWSGASKIEPMSMADICKKLSTLDVKVDEHIIWGRIKTAVDSGYMTKIEDSTGKYYIWHGVNIAM